MSPKKFFLLSLMLFGLVALFAVGCSDADKPLTSIPTISDDGSTVHDPPSDAELIVTDTLIDYAHEIREIAPWMLDSGTVAYRLSSDPRKAVVLEAILALTGWDWRVDRVIGGNAAGDWNYLANDLNAYNVLKSSSWYGSYSSNWSLFYSNPQSYGFYGGYGRGGQCVYFSNLITYRSGVYQRCFPSYATCRSDYYGSQRFTKSVRRVRIGDIIRSKWDNGHTAIVVKIMAGTEGSSVTSVDVIDCNYIGNEIIGRHIISSSGTGSGVGDLDNYYAVDLIALGGR